MVVGAGCVSYHQVQAAHRKKLAESVAVVSAVSSLPSPDILKDFDAIQRVESDACPRRAVARGAAMSLPGRKSLRVAVLLGASHLLSASLLAQAATNLPALTRVQLDGPAPASLSDAGAACAGCRRCRCAPITRSASSANCWR